MQLQYAQCIANVSFTSCSSREHWYDSMLSVADSLAMPLNGTCAQRGTSWLSNVILSSQTVCPECMEPILFGSEQPENMTSPWARERTNEWASERTREWPNSNSAEIPCLTWPDLTWPDHFASSIRMFFVSWIRRTQLSRTFPSHGLWVDCLPMLLSKTTTRISKKPSVLFIKNSIRLTKVRLFTVRGMRIGRKYAFNWQYKVHNFSSFAHFTVFSIFRVRFDFISCPRSARGTGYR